ncbi:cell wall metabolism sensor histidine kinase WalK [bacterium]|nr:cell wall metabolism sensor histidine kinase WalK [bacterium]
MKFELICRAVYAVGVIAVLVAGIVWLARRHRLIIERVKVLNLDKRRSNMVLERMADGIIAINRAGEVTLSNPAADQICGTRHPFVIGSQIEDTDAHPEIMRLAYECIASGEIMKSEIKLPGWPQRVVSIQSVPFSEDDSGTQAAMVILHDLTDVRRHEKNHKEFVGNVSHELKTPITAIRTTAEVLLGGAKNDPDFVDQFLNTIISETDRLSALIEDLLEIARRDSGIATLTKSCCNVAELVAQGVAVVLPQASARGIVVDVDVPDELVLQCDGSQIVQLIRNLVDNAVKYTPEGGSVSITARRLDECGLALSVQDTGIGIPYGEIDRIFERFHRVDKARSRRLGGTGLGLSIVKTIVVSHGGKIDVESQLGKGSIFSVTIPGVLPAEANNCTISSDI